eukprot:358863-Chlamydomonas_euryale.AAC.3
MRGRNQLTPWPDVLQQRRDMPLTGPLARTAVKTAVVIRRQKIARDCIPYSKCNNLTHGTCRRLCRALPPGSTGMWSFAAAILLCCDDQPLVDSAADMTCLGGAVTGATQPS